MSRARVLRLLRDHKGATVIFVAFAMVALLAFAALAVDVGYLYVVRNELQNAADAGALAGAQVLYNNAGTEVNEGAIDEGKEFVAKNYSEKSQAQVLPDPNGVEIGHWSFATRTFTPHAAPYPGPPALWDRTTAELDADPDFINAVRANTKRIRDAGQTGNLPAYFFAQIFGGPLAEVTASAVAYIGFAGTLEPAAVDQPIAICQQSILNPDNEFTCGVGRMLNSGQNAGHQTAGWTNFVQPCETASTTTIRPLVCKTGNPTLLNLGQSLGTTNGTIQTVYDAITDCWNGAGLDTNGDSIPDQPWELVLPVIDCPGGAVGNCSDLVGAVKLKVVWITRTDKNQMNEVPRRMEDWPNSSPHVHPGGTNVGSDLYSSTGICTGTGQQCWDSFVEHFNLRDTLNGTPAFYEDKTIYFLPECEANIPKGVTGGKNFGILAKIPVLVR